MEQNRRIGIWIRVSTEDQAQGDSPIHHEKRARLYAESKGWEVVTVYHLEGVSGKSVIEHPEAQRMMIDVQKGKITGLIFSKLARLARNTKQLLEFSDFFRQYNADLISLQESIDTSSPSGRLFYTIISAVAEWERENIVSRIKASVPVRAKMGKRLGGVAPLGYKWEDQQLKIEESEAPLRKLIYELFAEHKRKKTVARLLNEKGYRTRTGKEFSSQGITNLLRDPVAKGLRRANYCGNDGTKRVFKDQKEWIMVPCPAIVSEDLWDRCNYILEEQMSKRKKPTKKGTHLFSGKLVCKCGNKMYVASNSPKYICRKCRNKIAKDDMEFIFHSQLKSFLFSEKEVKSYLDSANSELGEKQRLYDRQQQEIQKLKDELNSFVKLHHQGVIPTERFAEHYQPVSDQLTQIEQHLPTLQGEIDYLKNYYLNSEEVLHEARDLHRTWEHLSHEQKKNIVDNIVKSIIVGKKDIDINLLYLPNSSPNTHPLLTGGKRGKQLFT